MSTDDTRDEILRTPTLFALGRLAERAGLSAVLELGLEDLAFGGELSDPAIDALHEIAARGRVKTVGELLSGAHPTLPRWKASRPVVDELRQQIKALLIQSLAPPDPSWQSRSELEAWAAREGIAGELSAPLYTLEGLPPDLMARLRKGRADSCPLVDAIFSDDFRGARIHAALGAKGRETLATAAARHLAALAEAIRRARATAEDIRASWPPDGAAPGVLRAGEVLLAEWERLQRHGERLLPLEAVDELRADVVADPPGIRLAMRVPSARAGAGLDSFRIRLELDAPGSACSCRRPKGADCIHVPAAILLVLRVLANAGHPLTRDVTKLLGTPAWMRTLEALDAALLPPPEDASEKRVVWRVGRGAGGAVSVWPVLQSRRGKGGWTKGTKLDRWDARGACERGYDRRAWAALSSGYPFQEPTPVAMAQALLELCGHDLVFLADDLSRPLAVVEAPVSLRTAEREDGAELVALVGDAELRPAELVAALDAQGGGIAAFVDEAAHICRLARPSPRLEAILRALASRSTLFPSDAVGPLLARVQALQQVAPVQLAPELAGREVVPANVVVLRLEMETGTTLAVHLLVRPLEGAAAFEPGLGPSLAVSARDGERVFARRDFDGEHAAVEAALRTLPIAPGHDGAELRLHGDEALDLLVHLAERAEEPGLQIEWPKVRQRITRPARAADVRAEVKPQRDWFGLAGGLEVDGVAVDLALALDAARRGSRYVEAAPGVFVALAEELRENLARAAEQVHEGRSGMELSFAAAPAIEALVEDGAELQAAKDFVDLLRRIRASRGYEAPLPEGLHAQLRPYQVEGFRWLARLAAWGAGGCLADDMGLGKTLQSLALLVHRAGAGPALVVAPTSVCGNWVREAERFAPGLRPIVYGAFSVDDREVLEPGPGDVLIVSYGLLARDIERLERWRFATAIFDEAQALKNPQTDRARAARSIDAEVRVALSGTPLENHLGELWSLYRVVLPGLLGSSDQFRERFALPIERGDAARRRALATVLRPFLLRRTKGEVATDLPPRTEIDLSVELSAAERRLYDEARVAAAARVAGVDGSVPPEKRRFEILAAITRLRLCACHPRLYDERSKLPSSKLARLLATLEELREEGHRALVFSQFTKHLDLVEQELGAAGIRCLRLDGSTAAARRQALVDRWQAGEGDAFLISLKAGGTGLNLTGADYVIHLDPWWNPAAEDQATDRAHRIGQTRPVTVLRLIARGTIEEQILSLHGEKRALLSSVLDGADGGARVDPEALLALLEAPPEAFTPEEDEPAERVEPAAGGGTVPACLGTDDPLGLAAELHAFLAAQNEAGRIGPGPVRSYPRAIERFAGFVAAGHAETLHDAPLGAIRDHYLHALRQGAWTAPQSEPALARAAFGQLEAMLRQRKGLARH